MSEVNSAPFIPFGRSTMLGLLFRHNAMLLFWLLLLGAFTAINWNRPWEEGGAYWGWMFGMFIATTLGYSLTAPALAFALTRPISRMKLLGTPLLLGVALTAIFPVIGLIRTEMLGNEPLREQVERDARSEGNSLFRRTTTEEETAGVDVWTKIYGDVLSDGYRYFPGDTLDLAWSADEDGPRFVPTDAFIEGFHRHVATRWLNLVLLGLASFLLFFAQTVGRGRWRRQWTRHCVSFVVALTPFALASVCGYFPFFEPLWTSPPPAFFGMLAAAALGYCCATLKHLEIEVAG